MEPRYSRMHATVDSSEKIKEQGRHKHMKERCTKGLHGLGVAMVTPFTPEGEIDRAATERLVESLLAGGVDFLVVLGTTGEACTLSEEEQTAYQRLVIQINKGRVPVMLGCSGNDTRLLVERLKRFDYAGVDYILSAVPSYNKPSQAGIVEHFARVAEASERPVVLYNVPGRTGMNMQASTCCRIAEASTNVVAIKEASGNLDQVLEILRDRPEGFVVLSGDDALTLPMMAMGAEGVISVIGNALPALFAKMVHHAEKGEYAEAARINQALLSLYRELFAEGNPAGVKCALHHAGVCGDTLRLPLVPVSEPLRKQLGESMEAAQAFFNRL